MLSLGTMKDGIIPPSEEDRKRIITQMKVRTTLKGDKSWIQQRANSEERNCSPSSAGGRSPISPRTLSPSHRITFAERSSQAESQTPSPKSPARKSPSASSPSGYLIRGVFTKTIDKTTPSNTVSNGSQKSAKSASLPRFSQGYKMSTEDYRRLAPYNVKRESADLDEAEPSVSPDEQKKRTEAASSILRQTARKERSYVLSAAKKSNGSPTQEAPPFLAKRIDIEDDTGPRSRSQTVPASAWFSSREKSTNGERRNMSDSPWSESRMATAASTTSIDTGSRNQGPESYLRSSSTFNHFSSLDSRHKADQEKSELLSWDDCTPKATASPPKRCEQDEGKFQPTPAAETQDANFAEDSWETRKSKSTVVTHMSQAPHMNVSPEASPKRSSSQYGNRTAGTTTDTHHRSSTREYLNDITADFSRSALDHKEGRSSTEVTYGIPNARGGEFMEQQPVTARPCSFAMDSTNAVPGVRYSVPTHLSDEEDVDPKRSFSDFEQNSTQEVTYKNPSDTEYKKVETHLAKSGSWSSESSLGTTGTQSELLRTAKRDESESDTVRSSSHSMESGVATPDSQEGERGLDSDTGRGATSGMPEISHRMPTYLDNPVYNPHVLESNHRTSSYLDCQAQNTARSKASHGRPLCLSNQSYSTSMLEMSHGTTSHLNNQAFNSSRSYYPFRDNCATSSSRSHRVPFYKDICETEARSKGLLFVKESINSTELSSPRYNSLVDMSERERSSYSSLSSLKSSPPKRRSEDICTYCGREIHNCAKITIENLKICCHEYCFRCGICHKPMGDLLDKIFIHRDIVHCDKCYEKLF